MTLICDCCSKCCSCCANCFQCICNFLIFNTLGFCCICFCFCLCGIAVMLAIIYSYTTITAYSGGEKIEIPAYLEYGQDSLIAKRDAKYGSEEAYIEENYYYNPPIKSDTGEDCEIARIKRENMTTCSSSTENILNTDQMLKNTGKISKSKNKKHKGSAVSNDSTQNTEEAEEEVLDFKLSNSFVDTIQAEAEQNKIKEPLGLCRRNINITMPSMNVTLFPLEQAQEIITCINDILKNQSKKRLCIELNDEMNAYLKWLILTGDSKERRKQIKISAYHDDFLFPTPCGSNVEGLTEAPVAPQPQGGPGGSAPVGPPEANPPPGKPP